MPTSRLAVALLEAADEVTVLLGGEAGVMEADVLEDSLLPLTRWCPNSVTFDLSELRFISGLAIGVLVSFYRAAVRRDIQVRIAPEMHPAVRDILLTTGVLKLFEIAGYSTEVSSQGQEPRLFSKLAEVERAHGVTWSRLVELEPQLENLLRQAREAGARCYTVGDVAQAFGPIRNDLAGLIGFAGRRHRHVVLGSAGAYHVAYTKLNEAVAGLIPAHVNGLIGDRCFQPCIGGAGI
jgi:anti-anti-sigma factor